MRTLLTKSADHAAEIIRNGGIVAFPTETVYGLGADIFNERAIENVFKAKGRPEDNPLIAHIGELDQIEELAAEITTNARKFIDAFFPGPLTLVLPKTSKIPSIATANLETIGIRMPKNLLARDLLKRCQTPLVAPSANLSGKPSPTNWKAVYEDLNGKIDCILQGEVSEIGLESTVLDCTGDNPQILRAGAVTIEDLIKVVPETKNYIATKIENPRSPGLKHKHYSPNAAVVLIDNENSIVDDLQNAAYIGINAVEKRFRLEKQCETVEEYAHNFFDFFRQCDRENIELIYCERVEEKGIGVALMDRLRRASQG